MADYISTHTGAQIDAAVDAVSTKQDLLTAGTGIDITDNTVSTTIVVPTKVSDLENDSSFVSDSSLSEALSEKQDVLTAGANISITGNTISATDTTYTAGEGIDITGNVISATADVPTSVSALKKELLTMSIQEQLEVYDAFVNGGATNWCDYTANGYQVTDMQQAPPGQTYGSSNPYTTDGTELQIRTLFDTYRQIDENDNELLLIGYAVSFFSPTIGLKGPYGPDGYLVNAEQEELLINLPTTLEGKQDTLTAGTGIDITGNVISATGGGGGNDWYGTQSEFDALAEYDADTNYFISDKIEYSEIKGAPNMANYYRKAEVDAKERVLDGKIASKTEISYMTQEQFDDITPLEGKVYAIEGQTIQMVVTFADSTTATYNVVVD